MSAIARIAPLAASRSSIYGQQRLMATAATSNDPIHKLFLDKVKELKTNFKGLDDKHTDLLNDEMLRLKRTYSVTDENKLAQLSYKFSNEHNISLRDLDESKELRKKIAAGESERHTDIKPHVKSELIASIPDQTPDPWKLPAINKPSLNVLWSDDSCKAPQPSRIGDVQPDYLAPLEKVTPRSLQRNMEVMFGPNMPTIDDDKAPERDTKNFPRIYQADDTPACRHHLVPESWFQALYNKTGASGPYAFAFSFTTFLMSKEYLVLEHELVTGITCGVIFGLCVKYLGPMLSSHFVNLKKSEEQQWDDWQKGQIDFLEQIKTNYSAELAKDSLIDNLYQARNEDINLQLEQEHRGRVKKIFDDTKRKLNYLVAVAESKQAIMQKYMVNWVISNSVKSIGAKHEADVLENCIGNLKQLSAKHANAI